MDDMHADVPSSVLPASPRDAAERIAFGPFRLAPAERRLEGDGKTIHLGGRALDILMALAAQPGRVVTKAQLAEAAWPGMVVEEANLRFHIGTLRKTLDAGRSGESYITTVAGRGYCLSAPVSRQPSGLAEGDPVVGRGAEEAELANLLSRAAAGEAQFAFVTGEAGIGKTALTARLVQTASATGAIAVIGRCLPSNAATDAYYPIIEMLMQLAAVCDDFAAPARRIAPTWAIQLPDTAAYARTGSRQATSGATHHRMLRELCALLEVVARRRLLLFVVEDVQWADQATLEVLKAFANRRLKARLLIVATMRPSDDSPSSRAARSLCDALTVYQLVTEIPLVPLSKDEIAEYLLRVSGSPPSPELSRHLHARSGGNPLFMRAMIEYWTHQGLIAAGAGGLTFQSMREAWELPPPPSLAGLIDDDIERLAPDCQQVILAASISEGAFAAAINHVATPLDEATFERVCEDLVRATALIERTDVLTLPGGRKVQGYGFRHMLFRDVAYARQSATMRATAHAAVAARIEQIHQEGLAPVAGILARHLMEAQNWASAVKYLRVSAHVALARFSPREAATALEQALAAVRNVVQDARAGTEVEIKGDLAPIYTASLDPRAPALYAELVSDAAAIGRLDIQCCALIGQALTVAWSDVARSLGLFREAIALSEGLTDAAERARIRSQAHSWCSFVAGWDPAHAAACEAAIEELRRLGDPVALAAGLVNWHNVLFASARYIEAYETIASSIAVLAANGRVDLNLPQWQQRAGGALCLLYAGRLGQAFESFKAGTKALLGDADLGRAATLQFYQALGHILLQDFAGAAALVQGAAELTAGSPALTRNERQMELAVRGLAALGQGEPMPAMRWLHLAGQEASERWTISTWLWSLVIAWGMTDACMTAGHLSAAREHARRFRELAYRTRERTWRALASESSARIALTDRHLSAAKAHLREAWEETASGRLPLAEWRLHAVEAALRAQEGDDLGAAHHRNAGTEALAELARTLPAEHVGQQTLKAARPVFRHREA